jgi:hypothetical protein
LGLFTNRWLLAGIGASLGALLLALYVPPFNDAFETETPGALELLAVFGFAALAPAAIEAVKVSPFRLRR